MKLDFSKTLITCGNSYNITKFSDFMEINLNIYHDTSTIKSPSAVQISKSIKQTQSVDKI